MRWAWGMSQASSRKCTAESLTIEFARFRARYFLLRVRRRACTEEDGVTTNRTNLLHKHADAQGAFLLEGTNNAASHCPLGNLPFYRQIPPTSHQSPKQTYRGVAGCEGEVRHLARHKAPVHTCSSTHAPTTRTKTFLPTAKLRTFILTNLKSASITLYIPWHRRL